MLLSHTMTQKSSTQAKPQLVGVEHPHCECELQLRVHTLAGAQFCVLHSPSLEHASPIAFGSDSVVSSPFAEQASAARVNAIRAIFML